jgi:hypothetical protein
MSDVWKRLANVAKGKVKALTDPSAAPPPLDDDDLQATPLSTPPARVEAPVPAPESVRSRRREALAMALADGVITRDEYEQRLADIEAGVGTPGKPKTRTL